MLTYNLDLAQTMPKFYVYLNYEKPITLFASQSFSKTSKKYLKSSEYNISITIHRNFI